MTKPQKTPRQLAEEHWMFLEGILLTQMKLTMKLFVDGMIHGYKHGREDATKGIRTRPTKK